MDRKEEKGDDFDALWAEDGSSEVDMEELLADARRLSETVISESEANAEPKPWETLERTEQKSESEENTPVPKENNGDPMDVMTAQMKELTEEVRLLRAQLANTRQESGAAEWAEVRPDVREEPNKKPKNKALNIISNILFYVVIIAVVVGALLVKSSSGGRPTVIAGFSAFRVLTSSMEDVYPKGSLIVSRAVDPYELKVGDDITFMVSETSSVTHRIISITENYLDTGARGFETQGVMNEKPDKDMVAAANIVGKVIFCSKLLGELAVFTKNNWPILVFVLVVIVALITFLKWNARREEDDTAPEKAKPKKQARVKINK